MLIYDAYQLDKKRCLIVLVVSAAGVGMLGLSLGLLLKYVKHLESDATLKYLGYSFKARDGYSLVFVSVSVLLLLILSAGMLLYGRLKTRDILVDYNLAALTRVAEKYGWDPPDEIGWLNDAILKKNIKTLYMGDSHKAAMAMRRLFEGFQHFLTAFGGIAVLLWLDAGATFYLMLIISFSLIFYSKITKRASQSTRKYENVSGESSRRSRALLDNISSWSNPDFNPAILRSITHEGFLKDNSKLFFYRFVTRSVTEFFSYVLTAIALCFLVLTLGYAAIEGKKSWASIVGFILVLKTVMQAFKTLFKILSEVTRIYPALSRLYEFNKKSVSITSKERINELKLVLSDDALSDKNEKYIILRRGDVIGISAPVSLSRYSIKFFEKILIGSKIKRKKNSTGLLQSMSIAVPLLPPLVPVTLRELLGIPAEKGPAELRSAAGSRAAKIEKVFPLDPDRVLHRHDMEKLSNDSLNWLSLVLCSLSGSPILLVHSSLVTEEWLRESKTMLKDHILVVCFNGLPDKQISQQTGIKTYIAAAADGAIVASGSFNLLKRHKAVLKRIMEEHERQLISKSKKGSVYVGKDDDDDDDD